MQYRSGLVLSALTLPGFSLAAADAATDQHVFNHHGSALIAAGSSASRVEHHSKMWPFSDDDEGADESKNEQPESVQYGPRGCVSTWRSSEGQCIMQTECEEEDIEGYNFGLVCVDTSGKPMKHVFGKGSFKARERFNTLIDCHECLGLEDIPDDVLLINDIHQVQPMVKELKDDMVTLTSGIDRLNAEVFTPAPAAAPASAPSSASPAGPADSAEAPAEDAAASFAANRAPSNRWQGFNAEEVARQRHQEELAGARHKRGRHVEKSVTRISREGRSSAAAKSPQPNSQVSPDPLAQAQNMLARRMAARDSSDGRTSAEAAYGRYMRRAKLARLQRQRLNDFSNSEVGRKLPPLPWNDGYGRLRR